MKERKLLQLLQIGGKKFYKINFVVAVKFLENMFTIGWKNDEKLKTKEYICCFFQT